MCYLLFLFQRFQAFFNPRGVYCLDLGCTLLFCHASDGKSRVSVGKGEISMRCVLAFVSFDDCWEILDPSSRRPASSPAVSVAASGTLQQKSVYLRKEGRGRFVAHCSRTL